MKAAAARLNPARLSSHAGVALIVLAVFALLLQLPTAWRAFQTRAHDNAARNDVGRMLAAADSLNIENDFVVNASSLLPPHASYAVLLPASSDAAAKAGITSVTFLSLAAYMRNQLLPRRQVAPESAAYLLCYACTTDRWDRRVRWIWRNDKAMLIGKVIRR
jgi:hypothetical protein